MRGWYRRRAFALAVGLVGVCYSGMSSAAVTVEAVLPRVIKEKTIYYAASTDTLVMDQGEGFYELDLSVSVTNPPAQNPERQLVQVEITNDQTFSSSSSQPLLLMAFASAVSGDPVPIPIAMVNGQFCDDGRCQGKDITGFYLAARAPEASKVNKVVLGFYPADICNVTKQIAPGSTLTGELCSGGVANNPTSAQPRALTLTLATGVGVDLVNKIAYSEASLQKSAETTVIFQGGSPSLPCGDQYLKTAYFPGDSQIEVNTDVDGQTNAAPITHFMVVAMKNGDIVNSSDFTTANTIFSRLALDKGYQPVSGFVNTTEADPVFYKLGLSVRDGAGVVGSFNSCQLNAVQSAAVKGVLAKSQCFIATAAYGEVEGVALDILRGLRDRVLAQSYLGRVSVRWYYAWSPSAGQWLREHTWARVPVLFALIPMIVVAWLLINPVVLALLFTGFAGLISWSAFASEVKSPYIDELKSKLEVEKTGSYTEEIREKIRQDSTETSGEDLAEGQRPGETYIDAIKRQQAERASKETDSDPENGSFLDNEKARLGPSDQRSAIQSVLDGTDDLKPKKMGEIKHAAGIRLGTVMSRSLTVASEYVGASYSSLYQAAWVPDLHIFGEYQVLQHPSAGTLGIYADFGFSLQSGNGTFEVPLTNALTSQSFSSTSRVKFSLITLPVTVGVNYRFNLLRYIQPYATAGILGVVTIEDRSDGVFSGRAVSPGAAFGGGINIWLDPIFKWDAWELYGDLGVKRYYLTVDYTQWLTFGGAVQYAVSGLMAGFTYEF